MDLLDKRVIITGGSKGIGAAIAHEFLRRGARVCLLARNSDDLESRRSSLEAEFGGDKVASAVCDVTDYDAVAAAVDSAMDAMGGIDGIVNNAGLSIPRYFRETPPEEFERVMRVNYLGSVYPTRAAIEHIPSGGFVSFVSSVAGYLGVFGYTGYCPTKFAQIGFAESLRQELRKDGIQVSVLCPPDAETPGFEEENKTKPYETKALSGTASLMSAEEVAKQFADGLRSGKFLITCNIESAVLYRLQGVAPGFVRWYLDRSIAKIQARRNSR